MNSQFKGHLYVRVAEREGKSYLAHRSFRAPLSLSKAYWTGETLLVQAVNPTAGMFAGDRVELRAEVGAGASLSLTTPAASRVFSAAKARSGELAVTAQHFTVEPGGWMEFLPEMFIPHAHCLHRQETRLEVAPDGGLLFLETIAPGRVASGESLTYKKLGFHAELLRDGELVYKERNTLSADLPDSLRALTTRFEGQPAYFVNGLFCPPVGDLTLPARDFQEAIAALTEPGLAYTGASLLRDGRSWAVRGLAANSLAVHRLLPRLREIIHQAAGRSMPNLRKL